MTAAPGGAPPQHQQRAAPAKGPGLDVFVDDQCGKLLRHLRYVLPEVLAAGAAGEQPRYVPALLGALRESEATARFLSEMALHPRFRRPRYAYRRATCARDVAHVAGEAREAIARALAHLASEPAALEAAAPSLARALDRLAGLELVAAELLERAEVTRG